MTFRFSNRVAAGQALAARMARLKGCDGVVLGLPRGGVPVAAEVARALGLPLSVIAVRKIGVPGNPELAAAAIGGPLGESLARNEALLRDFGLDAAGLERLAARERTELARRYAMWGAQALGPLLKDKTAILVDDGIATGATMRAAIAQVRLHHPARVVVAVPVAASDAVADIALLADKVICLAQPDPFIAVGTHYADFPQVSDEEVSAVLRAALSHPVKPIIG
jgi:putative phosphoribosyl transferase